MRRLWPQPADAVDVRREYRLPGGTRHLRANMVSSVDGAATLAGRSGGLSGSADQRLFRVLREFADVVLVGASTVRVERYGPVRPAEPAGDGAPTEPHRWAPPIAVVSASLQLDVSSRFFTEATTRPLVVTTEDAPADRVAAVAAVAEVVRAGRGRVDPARLTATLAARGLYRQLCEGGPALLGQLLDQLDEICLTLSPQLVGDRAKRIVDGPPLPPLPLRLRHVLEEDGYLFCSYLR